MHSSRMHLQGKPHQFMWGSDPQPAAPWQCPSSHHAWNATGVRQLSDASNFETAPLTPTPNSPPANLGSDVDAADAAAATCSGGGVSEYLTGGSGPETSAGSGPKGADSPAAAADAGDQVAAPLPQPLPQAGTEPSPLQQLPRGHREDAAGAVPGASGIEMAPGAEDCRQPTPPSLVAETEQQAVQAPAQQTASAGASEPAKAAAPTAELGSQQVPAAKVPAAAAIPAAKPDSQQVAAAKASTPAPVHSHGAEGAGPQIAPGQPPVPPAAAAAGGIPPKRATSPAPAAAAAAVAAPSQAAEASGAVPPAGPAAGSALAGGPPGRPAGSALVRRTDAISCGLLDYAKRTASLRKIVAGGDQPSKP